RGALQDRRGALHSEAARSGPADRANVCRAAAGSALPPPREARAALVKTSLRALCRRSSRLPKATLAKRPDSGLFRPAARYTRGPAPRTLNPFGAASFAARFRRV